MDYSKYLNKNQLEAVTTDMTHVRVVAGAGSGKTRVLTYRIAYLLSDMGVRASHILAITFTNKAAKEMKERVKKLVPEHSHDLQIKTFHSFAAFFLRLEIDAIGFSTKFTIMDEEDQENRIGNRTRAPPRFPVQRKGMRRSYAAFPARPSAPDNPLRQQDKYRNRPSA